MTVFQPETHEKEEIPRNLAFGGRRRLKSAPVAPRRELILKRECDQNLHLRRYTASA